MRKIYCILLALLLLMALAVPALAVSGSVSLGTSSTTVYRGDSFSVTATLSTSDAIGLGTVTLSYDSSALELVGGSCHVPNAAIGLVVPGQNAGTFTLGEGEIKVISGQIFTFQFKVKDTANFGSYTISSNAAIGEQTGQGISSGSTTVTVACKHRYENCTKVSDTNHESTCAICSETKTEAHTWDSGTVTKEATCKETGSKKLTCTGCGATKDETIPVSNNHKYSKWSDGGSNHSHTCSVCGKKETAAHTWNSGTVVTAATCTATGTKKQTCTGCGATQTVTVPESDHDYGPSEYVDEATHKHICKDCAKETTEAHQYGEAWVHDENWHYLRCDACGHEKDQAAHTPGPKATLTTDQVCTVCSRILQPKGEHVHTFAQQWSTDETGHWHACSDCNEKKDAAPHEFDDDCDAECNVCQMQREPAHVPAEDYTMDGTGHFYACTACGEKVGFAPHIPGPEATITSAQICTQCQYQIAPVLPHDHVFDSRGTLHSHSCACGEVYEAEAKDCQVCATFPWWIVCIAEAVVFGGAIVGLLLWKKRRNGA